MKPNIVRTLLAAVQLTLAVAAHAAGVPGQGTWESTLLGRNINRIPVSATSVDAVYLYDSTLNLTWLRNADYYNAPFADWTAADEWAANLVTGSGGAAVSDWRLPAMLVANPAGPIGTLTYDGSTPQGYNVAEDSSEMAHLFHVTLGNLSAHNTDGSPRASGSGLTNTGSFQNLRSYPYWMGTSRGIVLGGADVYWTFDNRDGLQWYSHENAVIQAMAVRSGDVAIPTVLYDQPPATLALGTGSPSAVNTIDNPFYQNRVRDRFRLATAATIREIRWRGTFDESAPVGFTLKIFDFLPANASQLNQPPVASFTITGTAGQTPAGTFNGAAMYDYRFVLPVPFAALGNNKDYWLEIIAQQTGVPDWSWAIATGGDGAHFIRLNGPFTDSGYFTGGAGDCAFTLYDTVGNPDVRIDAAAGPGGGGTVTGAGVYPGGASVTVTASAAAGYKFTNWKEGDAIVSTSAGYSFTPTEYRDLKAHFTGGAARSTITTSALPVSGCGTQGGGNFAAGQQVELAADPMEFFNFQGWYENDVLVSNSLTYTFTATGTGDRHFVARTSTIGGSGGTYSTRRLISLPSGAGTVTGGAVFQGTNITRTVTATPPPGRTFLHWTNGGSIVSYSATWTPPSFSLYDIFYAQFSSERIVTTVASPEVGGSVTGGGIFPNGGDPVNLVATPGPGFAFVSWTRGTTTVGTNPTLTFGAGAGGYNDILVANFVATRTITTSVSPAGAGNATTGSANDGSPVTVTALANPGYAFVNWTEDGVPVSISASYTSTALADRTLVANFTSVATRAITTSAAPVEGGTTSGGGIVNDGSSTTVVATPVAGYTFANWSENGTQVSTSASYTFTVGADRVLVANFNPLPNYTVSTPVTPAAGGSTTGAGSYMSGTSAALTATPNAGHVFWKWTVGGNLVSASPSYSFTVTANRTVTANFSAIGVSRTITTNANPTAGGTVSGGGTHTSGNSATVTATPNAGYVFTRWQESGVDVSICASYTFTVAGNRTLTARFSPGFIVTSTAAPGLGGTAQMSAAGYVNGATATATATPAAGWIFDRWTEGGNTVSTDATYIFTVTAARSLVANFYSEIYGIVEVSAAPAIGGTVTGAGVFDLGADVTVTATPAPGYTFIAWSMFGFPVSSERDLTFTLDGDYRLEATFLKIPALTIAPVAGPGSITLTWPADAADWVLQESTDLVDWWDSGEVPDVVGDQQAVTIPTVGESRYFRLAHP